MERAAWVALSGVRGMGPTRFRRLLDAFGDARAALEADPEEVERVGDLPEPVAEGLPEAARQVEQLEQELASLDEMGVRALIWEDEEYPARLLASSSAPPVLWWSGDAVLNSQARVAAVVGSREASPAGLSEAKATGKALAGAGVVVVSGLAAGVDAAAHEGALEAEGPTVGVCGCGILTALMRGREGLAGRVAEGGGLCSELMPTAPLLTRTLYARDRIIAALASAVIVVEARGREQRGALCIRRSAR